MIIFLGYTENRTKKVLLSDKHSAQIVYQIDGIDAGIYSIENAGTLLKELNDVILEIKKIDKNAEIYVNTYGINFKNKRIFIYADMDYRVERITRLGYYSPEDVPKNIRRMDKERREYHQYYTGRNWEDFTGYDLLINTAAIGVDGAVRMIKAYAKGL